MPEQDVLTRISQATGLTPAEISAWISQDDNYDLASLEDQLSAAVGEADDPLGVLVARGIISQEERDGLAR